MEGKAETEGFEPSVELPLHTLSPERFRPDNYRDSVIRLALKKFIANKVF